MYEGVLVNMAKVVRMNDRKNVNVAARLGKVQQVERYR